MFLICVATIFIVSFILNEAIEKPFLRLRKKILKKKINVKPLAEAAVL
jgi:peptidoglycan/LPS O-acetylase OafA/YrhL